MGEAGLGHFTRNIESSVSAGLGATEEQNRQVAEEECRKALEALVGYRIGLVAQDVEAVLSELVREDRGGYKHVSYQHLTAVLIEARVGVIREGPACGVTAGSWWRRVPPSVGGVSGTDRSD